MASEITKNFSVDVKFTKGSVEEFAADDIIYLRLLAQITKGITEQVEASMGIHEAHADGKVTVTTK